jgi:hypothetical protein
MTDNRSLNERAEAIFADLRNIDDEDLVDRIIDFIEELRTENQRLTTPKPKITITYDPPYHNETHPCVRGLHRFAQTTGPTAVCVICGAEAFRI